MGRETIVIVGGGVCAMSAAHTLRAEGYEGAVVIVAAEDHLPYERPPLSKGYLAGATERDHLFPLERSWYADNEVEVLRGVRASRIDWAARRVEADGERLRYSALLIATGGTPRRLDSAAEGTVEYLRTIEDAERLRSEMAPGSRLAIIGGGVIGCEVAATARAAGMEVTILEEASLPLAVLGEDAARVLMRIHVSHGVDVRTRAPVAGAEPEGDGVLVALADGSRIDAAIAVAGLGIVPNDELAARAGIEVNDGVLVDEGCRASAPDVYAAGDVARHRHPAYASPIRVEHHDNALKQGAAAARSMLGREAVYDEPHWFWSDQYGHNIQTAGRIDDHDLIVTRGSAGDLSFISFYLRGRALRGVLALNRTREMRAARRLLASHSSPDPARLADETVDLSSFIPRRAGRASGR
jgi:3-phenylpropionate/trans-cinnamate dioxygenase ferredoxin reductase subunit